MKPGQHRETARVIIYDPQHHILLLKTHFDPEVQLPARWITPGGGIDDGETPLDAAVRELREETGLVVQPEDLGEPIASFTGRWDWGDGKNHHTFVDHFYKLEYPQFDLDISGWTEDERRDVLEHRWWNIEELANSDELVGPQELVQLLQQQFRS
ncbi:NUDIX domain-containing protein [Rhodoluna sp.]|uniref:NUDIX hydrolase n=1 Tax=Rhodoluna sp. TaxID=1969481 RepID=UPI0025FE8EC0|nr:NUDIX domain-containing protein [Rhodoluna sp.]